MKIAAVLLLAILASAAAQKLNFSPEVAEHIATARSECSKKENVDPKYLEKLDSAATFPSMEDLKCYTLCMFNKFKLLNSYLTFKTERIFDLTKDPLLQEKLDEIVPKCLPKDMKVRSCEDAYDLHLCVIQKFN